MISYKQPTALGHIMFDLNKIVRRVAIKNRLKIVLLVAALILILFRISDALQAQPRPTIEGVESTPSCYQANQFQVCINPSCCATSHCAYSIEISNHNDDGLLMFFWADSPFVQVLSPCCVLLEVTDDFYGIDGLPMSAGPSVPMVMCLDRHGHWSEDPQMALYVFRSRLRELLPTINNGSGQNQKSAIIEGIAIQQILRRAGENSNLPNLEQALRLAAARAEISYSLIEMEIKERCDRRILYRISN